MMRPGENAGPSDDSPETSSGLVQKGNRTAEEGGKWASARVKLERGILWLSLVLFILLSVAAGYCLWVKLCPFWKESP